MANNATVSNRLGTFLGTVPPEGPVAYRVIADFSAGVDVVIDLTRQTEASHVSRWQSIYVDNSANAADITLLFSGTEQLITVKAGSQKYINIIAQLPMVVNAHSTGAILVTMFFMNVAVQNALDLETITAVISGTVTVTGAVTISPTVTDGTNVGGTIAVGGTAQVLMAANLLRKAYAIENQSTGPLYIRSRGPLGTVDATLDQNSLLIPSGFLYEPQVITLNALSIIGATTGQAYFARDYS